MANAPNVGEPAPDFELEGTAGRFHLADHRGERVVLLFYPGDETMVCTRQFCSYRDRSADMEALGATVVGISGQDVESHRDFTEHHGLTVPLLADPGREAAKRYGVSRGRLGTQRAAFVIDEEGIVRWRKLHTLGLDYVDVDELRDALATLGPAPSTPAA
jgi:thioredoxin-dependent peroxiredoxin